jgi:hypothetical protein
MLIGETLVFPVQDTLHLGHGPVSRAHDLLQGNVVWRIGGGVPHDHLRSHRNTDCSAPRQQLRGVPTKTPLMHHGVEKELSRAR